MHYTVINSMYFVNTFPVFLKSSCEKGAGHPTCPRMESGGGRSKKEYRHLPAFILLVLTEGPVHGGAVHTSLSKLLPDYNADSGAVYRTLKELEKNLEIDSSWDTSASGPPRKIYRLTETGWKKLDFWKEDIEKRLKYLNIFLKIYKKL